MKGTANGTGRKFTRAIPPLLGQKHHRALLGSKCKPRAAQAPKVSGTRSVSGEPKLLGLRQDVGSSGGLPWRMKSAKRFTAALYCLSATFYLRLASCRA